jgi:hypothetical protein
MTDPTPTFRDRIRQLSPPWLQHGNNEKFLYAMAVQLDAFSDALTAAVKSRFPNLYSDESLPLIGRERRIARGPAEASETYAVRLTRWLDDHRRRGGPYAMLAQLHAYFAPNNFPIDLVYRNGRTYQMDVDGNVARTETAWSPDTHPDQWARWWLFFYTDAYPSPTAQQIAELKVVPHDWNAAHCFGYIIVFPSTAELWDWPLGHTWDESGTWDTGAPSAVIPVE